MNRIHRSIAALIALFDFTATSLTQGPEMPAPQKEHEWLKAFVGDWTSSMEASMGPDTPPMKCTGKETARMLGGFWLIADGQGDMLGTTFNHQMTLGYDAAKKKYIGTWVDSMAGHMWIYEGSVDATGKILTLEAEGPNFMAGGKMTKFRDVTEFKTPDHRIFTSSMLGEDGKWITFVRGDSHRKGKEPAKQAK
jgi:hypothetical protein